MLPLPISKLDSQIAAEQCRAWSSSRSRQQLISSVEWLLSSGSLLESGNYVKEKHYHLATSTGAAMDLVELTILTVLLGGIVLAVATLWAWRGTRTRQAEEERVSGPPSAR